MLITKVWPSSDMCKQLASGNGCFNTGVNLPQGATITALTAFWTSGIGAGHPAFQLFRHSPGGGPAMLVAGLTVIDDTAVQKPFKATMNAAAAVVNNNQHVYGLQICLPGTNDLFHGARIAYTYTHAGD